MNDRQQLPTESSDPPSDEQLARRAQAGCAASFEQLVRRLQVPLVQFLMRRTRCRANAEDVAQETFVRAYRSLDRYSDVWRFRTWLFTIACRLSINSNRRPAGREQTTTNFDAVCSPGPEVSELLAAEEERRNLWETAAEVLETEEVTALWLHYVEELPTAEVAQVLGRSRAGVKTMLFRARQKLSPHLRALVETSDAN